MSGGLHSLATVMKRLEAATSRLEDLADEQSRKTPRVAGVQETSSPTSYGAPAAPAPPPPPPPPAPPAPASASMVVDDPPSVSAYDEIIIQGKLKPFLDLTKSLGSESLTEQVVLVEKELTDLRVLLLIAASCQKPDQKAFGELLNPLQADIEAIARLKQPSRKDRDWQNHLTTVAEGAPCVGWVTVDPKPVPFVESIKQSSEFYGNRVIKEYKEKDPKHGQWVRAYYGLLDGMRDYVKAHHTTGLVWNPKGVSISQFKPPAPGAAAGGPPPPPPPPPPVASKALTEAGGTAALLASINQGESVTSKLKKVSPSQQTHKNKDLRVSSVVPDRAPSPSPSPAGKRPLRPSKPAALAGKKPSKFALEGKAWNIEYQEDEPSLVVENGQLNQSVNIFGCKKSTIIVKGKVNAVTLVNCTKVSVLIDSVIASVAVTNSPSFTIQITGAAPMIQLDSTDSGQIYLSKESLNAEITTAKCSSINISLPVPGEEDGVFEEQAVPEMLKTVIVEGKLVTTVVEHIG